MASDCAFLLASVTSAGDSSHFTLNRPPLRSTRRKSLSSTATEAYGESKGVVCFLLKKQRLCRHTRICVKDDCFISDQKSLPYSRKRNASSLVKWEEEVSQTTSTIIAQPPGRHNKLTLLHIDNTVITLNAGGFRVKKHLLCFR